MFTMRVGIHIRSIVDGVLSTIGIVAGAVLYGWLIFTRYTPSGHRTGQQILLILFSPVAAGALVYGAFWALYTVRKGLTRYTVGDELTIHGLPLTRVVQWREISNFELPPESFPDPPTELVLVCSDGRREVIPIDRFRQCGAEALLRDKMPGLA